MQKHNYIDLHSHSIASLDGSIKPKDLIDLALKNNVKYYAISDHDSTYSLYEAVSYSKNKLDFIPAIEISSIIDDIPLHILGYNIDFTDIKYKQRSEYVLSSNIYWAKQLLKKAHEYGFIFNDEDVYKYAKNGAICEEMLGEVILNDPRNNNNEQLFPFRNNNELADNPSFNFYKVFCSTNKPLYVKYDFNLPIKETSDLIHSTGGKMFLAHPYHNIKTNIEIFNKIKEYNLDGIEVFSSYHNIESTKFYYDLAIKNNLYMSVGSDFHGESKPSIKMASIDYDEQQLLKTIKYIKNE